MGCSQSNTVENNLQPSDSKDTNTGNLPLKKVTFLENKQFNSVRNIRKLQNHADEKGGGTAHAYVMTRRPTKVNDEYEYNDTNLKDVDNSFFMDVNVLDYSKHDHEKKEYDLHEYKQLRERDLLNLDNKELTSLNYSAKRIKKYFKNQTIPEYTEDSTEKFTDDLFLPNTNSVFSKDKKGKPTDPINSRYKQVFNRFQPKSSDIVWLRPEEFFPGGKYTIFEESIDIDDVLQGSIGNCYFMSSLAAMCEYPQLIGELFRSFTVNKHGYYEVVFNLDGQWKVIIVDDYIPCNKTTNKPIFSKPKNNELWVLILEKAWAKVNGGYLNIVGGWPNEVLEALTGFCNLSITNKDYTNLWDTILSADKAGHLITCSSHFEKSIEKKGLISGHAFTIISAHEAKVRDKYVRLLRIRNPWGFHEWNGAWSDNSPEWDLDAKQAFGEYANSDDGTFFIKFDDYLDHFLETQICKVISPACTKSIPIEKHRLNKGNVFELQLTRKSHVDISLVKKTFRFHRQIPEDAELVLNAILCKKDHNKLDYLKSISDIEHNPNIEVDLKPGTYLIYIFANYKYHTYDKIRRYRFYIICNNYFSLTDLGVDENFDILKSMLKNHMFLLSNRIQNNGNNIESLAMNKFENTTLGFFYLKNTCEEVLLEEQQDTKIVSNEKNILIANDVKNFELFHSDISNFKEFIIKLKPQEEVLIVGDRKKFYDEYWFKISFKELSLDFADQKMHVFGEKINNKHIQENIIQDIERKILQEENYDYFFKRHDIEKMSGLAETFDYSKIAEEYFKLKYPQYVKILYKMPSIYEDVKFMDIYDSGDSVYFGEWKKSNLIKQGRGITKYKDGSQHVGYYQEDQFNGKGLMIYKNGVKIEISFINGQMDGEGLQIGKDGNIRKCNYEHGVMKHMDEQAQESKETQTFKINNIWESEADENDSNIENLIAK